MCNSNITTTVNPRRRRRHCCNLPVVLVVLLIVGIIDLRRRKNAAEAAASPNRGNGLRSRDVAASSNPMYAAVTGIADTLYAIPLEDDGQRGSNSSTIIAAIATISIHPCGFQNTNVHWRRYVCQRVNAAPRSAGSYQRPWLDGWKEWRGHF